jgi:hypothetical protein
MTWERKIPRKIYGPTKANGQWRTKTNSELTTKYKSQDTVSVINIRRSEWLGHIIRINEARTAKKIFEGKLEGRRGRGRPRLRWINKVEDDLRRIGVKRWRMKALEREEWASVVKEALAREEWASTVKEALDREEWASTVKEALDRDGHQL